MWLFNNGAGATKKLLGNNEMSSLFSYKKIQSGWINDLLIKLITHKTTANIYEKIFTQVYKEKRLSEYLPRPS